MKGHHFTSQSKTNKISKNFSSSPDSNESIYSSSTPLPFEANYEKSTLIKYREDSDDNDFPEDNIFYQELPKRFNNNDDKDEDEDDAYNDEEDVIEIDSFDSSCKQEYKVGMGSHFHDKSPRENASFWNHDGKEKLCDSDDSDDDDSLPAMVFSTRGMEKATCNNIHSIRERQRRLKLKNLLMKLKIQLFEAESDSTYDLDNSESQIQLDEYCNNRNFKKATLKSKQNILQEVNCLEMN